MDKRVFRCNYLIKKIQKGNEKALDELFKEYGALFLNMAKKYLFDKSYAEDLLSEMFLELLKKEARSFDENKNGLNWIFTIIRRKAYRLNERNNCSFIFDGTEYGKHLSEYFAYEDNPFSENSLDKTLLKKALDTLTEEENKIIYYKYWEGLTVREIAGEMNIPRSTIQYKIKEILSKLKEYWNGR